MNLAYVVDIDNRGPMEPHELARLPVTALRVANPDAPFAKIS
jgi:hypothetical protein